MIGILIFSSCFLTKAQNADTIFLDKGFTSGVYHECFIDPNKSSKYYKILTNFSFRKHDSENYISELKYVKDKGDIVNKFSIKGISKKWCMLYTYKSKYYVYIPNDGGTFRRFQLTDSAAIGWNMDGPYPEILKSFEKLSANTYKIVAYPELVNAEAYTLIIHIIDAKRQIAVFEYILGGTLPNRYELRVSADKVKDFPIIINKSSDAWDDFNFDKPNFEELLKDR